MDDSQFRQSDNIEDRRKQQYHPEPGVFGDGSIPNVFDEGHGTMAALNAATDFVPQPNSPAPLSADAGINSLPTPSPGSIFARPSSLLSNVAAPIIQAESGGNPNAQNPNSSASGLGQFIDSTFLDTLKAHRPDLAQGKSDSELLALKTDPQLSAELTGAYAADNGKVLSAAGLPVTPRTTYLAHFAGPQGAVKILQADPGASAGDILGPAVVKANPFLKDMTAQGLQAWAAKKMGTAAPQAGPQGDAPVAPPPPAAAPAPMPQQAPPIFAGQPQGAPQAAPQPFMTPPAMPPIFAAQRKPIDLSGLQAALAARAPIFANRG